MSSKLLVLNIFIDIALCGMGIYLIINFRRLWPQPPKTGFFCDDESLSYPYKSYATTESIIAQFNQSLMLLVLLPLMVMLPLEIALIVLGVSRKKQLDLRPTYVVLRCLVFGYIAAELFSNVGKVTSGRLRPHFFDVCRPELANGMSCAGDGASASAFHDKYNCTGAGQNGITEDIIADAYKSFPSGHSIFIFYEMVFLIRYVQLRLSHVKWFSKSLLRPVLQWLFILVAWWIALTRIAYHRHHWHDVIAGSCIGCGIAYVTTEVLLTKAHLAETSNQADDKQKQSPEVEI